MVLTRKEDPITRELTATVPGDWGWKPFRYLRPPMNPGAVGGLPPPIRDQGSAAGSRTGAWAGRQKNMASTTSEPQHSHSFTKAYQALETRNLGRMDSIKRLMCCFKKYKPREPVRE